MKNILLTILFTFSVSLLQADDKHVIIKKIIVGSEQEVLMLKWKIIN